MGALSPVSTNSLPSGMAGLYFCHHTGFINPNFWKSSHDGWKRGTGVLPTSWAQAPLWTSLPDETESLCGWPRTAAWCPVCAWLGCGCSGGSSLSVCFVYNGIQLWDQRSARRPRTGLLSEEASSIKPWRIYFTLCWNLNLNSESAKRYQQHGSRLVLSAHGMQNICPFWILLSGLFSGPWIGLSVSFDTRIWLLKRSSSNPKALIFGDCFQCSQSKFCGPWLGMSLPAVSCLST